MAATPDDPTPAEQEPPVSPPVAASGEPPAAPETTTDDRVDEPDEGDRRGAPGWFVWIVIVVASLVAMGAVLNTWINRQVLETDEWVEVAEDLLDDDDIRGALATYLVGELFRAADVQGGLEELLPEEVGALSGPLAATLESNAVPVADRLLTTSAVRETWSSLNEATHQVFVSVVKDELPGGLTTLNGQFAIELDELVTLVGERIGLPDDVLERIDLDAGTLVIFESEELEAIQQVVAVIEFLSVFLLLAVVGLYALAVWLSADRRRTLRNVGWSVVVASVLLLLIRRATVEIATDRLADADSARAAVSAIVTITTNLLNELAWAGVAIGLLIVAYTVLVGPTRAAARVRRVLQPVLTNTVSIYAAGFVGLLLLFAFVPGFTLRTWAAALVFGGLAVAAIELTRRFCVAEREAQERDDRSADERDDQPDEADDRSSEYTSID